MSDFWQGFLQASVLGAVAGGVLWLVIVMSDLLFAVQSWWRR